ncbi:carbohydrate ABC transporter membrane protein 2, CUT1 family [Pacificibacter marinus]|uniref:Inner membrane ABC transporter permease protein YcjP n=2 Tax=Pacificibacter marinus TaxID=658057 RepID=A0A1Y5RFZ8_9RHOB|nr:carbohydrate ABC transporter membrane protein 2, CUT1 family [Pacificibacter marinus]SLN16648.1 Inner membrane ABC transporter permease protein YcjP [Pacificibacter marinus]
MGAQMANRITFGSISARVVLACVVIFAVFPVVWTLLNSFKEVVDIVTPTPKLFFTPTLENFRYVFERPSVRLGLSNSGIIVFSAVALGALFGIPAAYALAHMKSRVGDEIKFFVLSLRFLPPVAVAIPLMSIYLDLGLYDTRLSLTMTYVLLTLSTIIWLSIPAFERVPQNIEEAARLDGYGPYAIFFLVALPVAGPSLFGAIIFSFILVWNEFLIALMLTTSEAKTLPIVASEFTLLGRNVPWGILNASVIVLSIPPLIFLGVLSGFLNRMFKK